MKELPAFFSGKKGSYGFTVDGSGYEAIEAWNDLIKTPDFVFDSSATDAFKEQFDEVLKKYPQLEAEMIKTNELGKQQAITYRKVGSSYQVAASGAKGFAGALKILGAQTAVMLVQFALITAAVWAVGKAIELVKNNIPTTSNLAIWAEEATNALQETRSEIESINSELQTTRDRIAELQSKGPLTLTEQDELERLKDENDELERRLALKKADEAEQAKKSVDYNMQLLDRYLSDVRVQKSNYDKQYEAGSSDKASKLDRASLKTYTDDLQETLDNLSDLFSSVSTSDLDAEQLEKFNAALREYAAIMLNLKKMGKSEALEFAIGSSVFDEFNDKLSEMAKDGELVSSDLSQYFSKDVVDALLAVGYTADDINEHIKALATIEDYLNNNLSPAALKGMEDAISDKNFVINEESVKSLLGEDFIKQAERDGNSIDVIIAKLKELQAAKLAAAEGISGATSELLTIEEHFNAFKDAVNEFKDNDHVVSAKTLSGLSEAFESISDTAEFEKFINVLGNAKSSVGELNAALDDVVDSYVNAQMKTGSLTEETKDLYIAQMKQMGVTNADVVVNFKLAKATLDNADASDEARQAAYEYIASLDSQQIALSNSADMSLTAADALVVLRIQMELCKTSDFTGTMSRNIDAIISLGKAAGANGSILVQYASILSQISKLEKDFKNGDIVAGRNYAALRQAADRMKEDAQAQFNDIYNGIGVNANAQYKPAASSKKSGSKTDKNKEAYDKAKKKLDHQLAMNKISYANYYKQLVALGKKYFKKDSENRREHYETLADVRRSAFKDYKDDLDNQLENGKISISSYYKKVEALIKKWYKGRKSNAEDAKEAEVELQKQIADAWKNRISDQETQLERMTLSKVWPDGKSELDYWKDQMKKLQSDYRKGIFKDKESYLEIYYQILSKIRAAEKDYGQERLDEVTKKISAIDDLVEMVSKMLKQRIEDEIDALEKLKSTYSDIIDQKKESLELTRDQLEYEKEINELNEDLTKLQAQAELLKLDTSRAGQAKYADLMEQIREKQKDISDKQSDHTYDATVDKLDKADEQYQEHIQTRIDSLNEQMENQGEWLRYVYSYIESTDPSTLLSELTAYNYKYGDGINQTVTKIWDAYSQYADKVYGESGYLASLLDELRNLEIKYQKEADSTNNSSDSTPSDNYQDNFSKSVLQSNLVKYKNNSTKAEAIRQQVQDTYGGQWWYDKNNGNIYRSDTDNQHLISASAYPYIKQMKAINNNSSLSKATRKKQLDAQLKSLKKLYGYTAAHLVEGKNGKYHLYKTKGKEAKWQIFHDGIQAGYTGANYVPTVKQKELLALLKKGELVFNQKNQDHLLSQLQAVNKFSEAFKGITPSSISQYNYGNAPISLGQISINIYGSADDDTIKKLRKEAENISNMTVDKINKALTQKGFNSGAARGTFTR